MERYSPETFEKSIEKKEEAKNEFDKRNELLSKQNELRGMLTEFVSMLKGKDSLSLLTNLLEADKRVRDLLDEAHEEALKLNAIREKLEQEMENTGSDEKESE
jgi:hypothetical protein